MVKPEGEQRKSDGVVVPLIGVRNAPGGKGPDFDHAGGGGKRKGHGRDRPVQLPRMVPLNDHEGIQRGVLTRPETELIRPGTIQYLKEH